MSMILSLIVLDGLVAVAGLVIILYLLASVCMMIMSPTEELRRVFYRQHHAIVFIICVVLHVGASWALYFMDAPTFQSFSRLLLWHTIAPSAVLTVAYLFWLAITPPTVKEGE